MVSIISYIFFFKLLITNLFIKLLGLVIELAYILIKIDASYYPIYPRLIEIICGFIFLFIFQARYDKDSFIAHFSKLEQEQFWKNILNVIPNNIMILSNRKSLLYSQDTLKKHSKKDGMNKNGVDILKWKKLKIRQESMNIITELIGMMEMITTKQNTAFDDINFPLFSKRSMGKNLKSFKSGSSQNINLTKDLIKQFSKEQVILLFYIFFY